MRSFYEHEWHEYNEYARCTHINHTDGRKRPANLTNVDSVPHSAYSSRQTYFNYAIHND